MRGTCVYIYLNEMNALNQETPKCSCNEVQWAALGRTGEDMMFICKEYRLVGACMGFWAEGWEFSWVLCLGRHAFYPLC